MSKTFYFFLFIHTFFSSEGFGQKLQLKINGQTEAETKIIDSLNYTINHKDYISIASEVDAIQNNLYQIGYIENEVTPIKKLNDSSFVTQFNLKNKFNTIYIYYNQNNINETILKLISKHITNTYFIINISEIETSLNFINSEISQKGFPFSKLNLSNIRKKDATTLAANLTINTSDQKRSINNIIIKGYEKFPRSYLKYYLKIKQSQVFDLKTIQEKTEQLNSLNFANETKAPEVLFSQDSTTLYLYIEKNKSNTFDGYLGFGTNEDTNKLEFDGYLNLNLINNLNYGESFRVLYKSDEGDQKTFEADLSLPYIFKSPIGIDLLLRIYKQDSSFTTANQSAKLHYQINAKNKVYAGIASTESNNLQPENLTGLITDYKTFNYTFAYQYLKAQYRNLLFPINSKVYTEVALGQRTTTSSKENQSLYAIDGFKIFNLNTRNSFYLRANAVSLNSNTYFENELLRFGGVNSIRGFEENSIYATLYGLINTEYRYQINNTIYIHSIIDTAYFQNKIIDAQDNLYSFGFGFGLLTKTGLFKLNYANGKSKETAFKLSNSLVHISLLATF